MKRYEKPHPVSDIELSFSPRRVIGTFLPLQEDIPDEFRELRNPWCDIVRGIFFQGDKFPKAKQGIDEMMAIRHITSVLRSSACKHEHKEGGAAYLMSLWFELPQTNKERKMSLSIHVVGYRPPDARWNEMKSIYEACKRAKIPVPKEVESFFGFDDPSDKPGMEVPLSGEALQQYEGEYQSGYEVDVSRIPSDVRFIRFYISG